MSKRQLVPLSEVLSLDRDEVQVDPSTIYQTAGIRSFGRGLFARPPFYGAASSYTRLYCLHEDQVVFSQLFAWEGAVTLVESSFEGWMVSPEFPTFSVDEERALPAFVRHVLRWQRFQDKVWLADRDGLCSVDQYVLRPHPGVSGELLAFELRGRRVLSQAIGLTHNLQLPRLRSGLLSSLQVPVLAEGDAAPVVRRLEELQDRLVQVAEKRQHQRKLVAALLPSALNEAFAGLS